MLLAIDTATRTASLALYHAGGIEAEVTWRSHENHTVEVMAQVIHLLGLAKVDRKDLVAIGVALGPGSFTGLRVGMSVAKGLAFGMQVPLVGVPTLDAVAQAHAFRAMPLWAVLAAGRGRYSVARYAPHAGSVERVSDYALVTAAGLAELAASFPDMSPAAPVLFGGDVDTPLAQALAERMGDGVVFATPAMNVRRAGYMAELAWSRWQGGQVDDTASLAPMYAPHAI